MRALAMPPPPARDVPSLGCVPEGPRPAGWEPLPARIWLDRAAGAVSIWLRGVSSAIWERGRAQRPAAADRLHVVSRLMVQDATITIVEFESSRFLVAISAKGQISLLKVDPRKAKREPAASGPGKPARRPRPSGA